MLTCDRRPLSGLCRFAVGVALLGSLACVACAQTQLPTPVGASLDATHAQQPADAAQKPKPKLTPQEWSEQFNAYLLKKAQFLSRLRNYIETDHTDVASFSDAMGDTVDGVFYINEDKTLAAYTGKTFVLEGATWAIRKQPHNVHTSRVHMNFNHRLPQSNFHRNVGEPTQCLRNDEFKKTFTDANWDFVSVPFDNGIRKGAEEYLISKNVSRLLMRPRILFFGSPCLILVTVRFIKE
jgi:hypothetical protein